jgi:hypothetical protein
VGLALEEVGVPFEDSRYPTLDPELIQKDEGTSDGEPECCRQDCDDDHDIHNVHLTSMLGAISLGIREEIRLRHKGIVSAVRL